jgi:hypothetical protein
MSEQTMTNENSTVDLPALADDDTATPSEPIPQLDEHVTKVSVVLNEHFVFIIAPIVIMQWCCLL